MDESKVREIVAHNNKELLSQIKDLVSPSISDLKRSSDANSAKQMSEIKRLKGDTPPSFNKKSNEDQHKATKCVLDAVEDASSSLERKDLQTTHLEKGMSLLKERQKLILLADKSTYGWKTVLEYKHHDLAEDDEDGKKIYRAETRAARTSKRFAARALIPSVVGRLLLHDLPRLLLLTFQMLLVDLIRSCRRLDLPVFAFPVGSQATGEPLAQICFFLPVRKINSQSD